MSTRLILCSLLLIVWGGAAVAETPSPRSAITTATQVAKSIDAGRFDEAVNHFNPALRSALTAGALRVAAGQIRGLGDVLSSDDPIVSAADDHTVVALRERRMKGSIELRVAIDKTGQVAGLHYVPVSGNAGER